MRMQQHLYFIEHMMPAQTVVSRRQIAVDVLAGDIRQRSSNQRWNAVETQIPACRMRCAENQTVRCEMRAKRSSQCARFVRCWCECAAVYEQQLTAVRAQMHRIAAQPVGLTRIAAINRKRKWRDRPVVLARDFERLA